MKKIILTVPILLTLAFTIVSCGGPSVSAVPITAPWDSMDLPVKNNARVWGSTPTELKVVHQDDKPTVLSAYQAALAAKGWKAIAAKNDVAATVEYQKDGKSLELYIYDFEKTGAKLTLK